jgi:SpoVK/Ycf46/Vps4 family AAA+-type ATPase
LRPVVVVLDDVEALAPRDGGGLGDVAGRLVLTLLDFLEAVNAGSAHVAVICVTGCLDLLHAAVRQPAASISRRGG